MSPLRAINNPVSPFEDPFSSTGVEAANRERYEPPFLPSQGNRGMFGGGYNDSTVIDYVTITTTGDATDFGDLTVARTVPQGLSDVHGGIGD